MKKLYKKGTVHPTPPPLISDHLSFLPAAIFTLTLSLSPDDKEVLAYLLSSSSNNYYTNNINNIKSTKKNKNTQLTQERNSCDHPPCFNCSCFRCYLSFWVRWDASPNRQLIHEIIDAFEDGLTYQGKKEKGKKERRRKGNRNNNGEKGGVGSGELSPVKLELGFVKDEEEGVRGGGEGEGEAEEEELAMEEGSIRRFVSFVGEKIWGVWN